jgi:ABC-type nickel/cobalt efflux system permease component RcnA
MINLISIIALGFFLGMRHATDPDHVIAVTTIVSRERQISKSAWIGAFWGIGHTLTIFLVGAAIILFDLVIPPRLGLSMELSVALMLIILGLINVKTFLRAIPASASADLRAEPIHSHPHTHGDYIHSHPHGHSPELHPHRSDQTPLARIDRALLGFRAYRPIRPLIIGIVHGLAGSAAVALLVLTTIPKPEWAVAYLLVFGVGTIAGMTVITVSIASGFYLLGGNQQLFRRLALGSGLLSLGFGLVVAYQICVLHGLFAGDPHWTPR